MAPLRLRAIAAVVDFLVITGLGIAAVQAAVFLGSGWCVEVGADLVSAATFLVGWGYFAGMEVGFEGRTVGKMGTGLRVVASGGGVGVEPVWVSARYLLKAVQVLFGSGLLFGVVVFRVPTPFVLWCTLRASHLELGGVDLDLAVEDDVLPLDRADVAQQVGLEREIRRGDQP